MTIIALIVWLGLLSILCIGGIIHMMDQSRPGSVASRNPQATPGDVVIPPLVTGASFSRERNSSGAGSTFPTHGDVRAG